jgi:hypothetical protein
MTPHLQPQAADHHADSDPAGHGLVDLIAAGTPSTGSMAVSGSTQPLIGVCIDERHPTLDGRVLVRIQTAGLQRELWIATLAHVPVRRDDRVLVIQPGNWPECLVIGVVDGLRPRQASVHTAAALTLKDDEALEIRDATGAALLAIAPSPAGPVLKLARRDQRIEVDGQLVIAADAIAFSSRAGMTLQAGGDVVITGEQITLN